MIARGLRLAAPALEDEHARSDGVDELETHAPASAIDPLKRVAHCERTVGLALDPDDVGVPALLVAHVREEVVDRFRCPVDHDVLRDGDHCAAAPSVPAHLSLLRSMNGGTRCAPAAPPDHRSVTLASSDVSHLSSGDQRRSRPRGVRR
jgi:hypothetical protein